MNENRQTTSDEIEESDIDLRKSALAAHLDIDVGDIEEARYGNNQFDAGGLGEYLVLTDAEADDKAREYIEDSLWAFRAEFLADFTDLPVEVFQALQSKCEDANDPIRRMIERADGIDDFVSQAIDADGRGHFIGQYDGAENEEGEFYIYRTN
jgi:hypothetical protein